MCAGFMRGGQGAQDQEHPCGDTPGVLTRQRLIKEPSLHWPSRPGLSAGRFQTYGGTPEEAVPDREMSGEVVKTGPKMSENRYWSPARVSAL